MNKKPYYITTAIAYTSGKPHIGNVYEIVLADAIARFMRLYGYDVYLQTGTDEHGQKIQTKAEEAGVTPQEFVDGVASEIRRNWDIMNTSYDGFVRTTDPKHEKTVQKIFKKLYEQDDIYKGEYEGMYCSPCESFFTPSQLADGKCPDCGGEVSYAKEEAYFFRISKYQDALVKHIEAHPDFIQPESRKNEMLNNFIKPGLKDLCVSRTSFNWGIPVDFDPKHVVYVWIDALSNYITFLGYDPDGENGELFEKYWPADVHLIGKDILRFHTIYWPIMLMALGVELPKKVFGHPWLLIGEGKMSKSKGNVIYADDLVNLFGVDAVRYFVLKEMPFAQDGSMTYELLIERINGELVNILGNLVNRTAAMTQQYFGGIIPEQGEATELDCELIGMASELAGNVAEKMDELRVSDSIQMIFNVLRRSNKYIDETTPWVLAKDEAQAGRLGTVLYNLLESIRFSAVLLKPFLPESAEKILQQLNTKVETWESLETFDGIQAGDSVGTAEVLFARIDEAKMLEEIAMNKAAAQAQETEQNEVPVEEKDTGLKFVALDTVQEIGIEEFAKIQFVVGHVLECKKHPKADRLLVSQVQVGEEVRQIVSGIASSYEPSDMIGKQVIVVANLKPVTLRGELSQGMILAATKEDGGVSLVTVDQTLLSGSKVK